MHFVGKWHLQNGERRLDIGVNIPPLQSGLEIHKWIVLEIWTSYKMVAKKKEKLKNGNGYKIAARECNKI